MPKLKSPFFSFDARGTLAKMLTLRRRGKQHILEQKPIPTDAKSSAQLIWRHMYQKAIALWNALSDSERQEWESLARPKHMPGMAYFISMALKPNPGLYLPLQGGTMQGDIDMAAYRILNLPTPSLDKEPAPKDYVDLFTLLTSFNDHSDRHKWGGADVFDYGELFAGIQSFWPINWITHDQWVEDHSGTGSIAWALGLSKLNTGATSGSRAKIRIGIAFDFGGEGARCKFSIQGEANGLGNCTIWLGSFRNDSPTDTIKHVAFKIIDGAIWASSADGTTQEITDLGVDISGAWSVAKLYYKHLGSSIEFYVGGVLKATHTTYLGGGSNHRIIFQIVNSVAALRKLRLKMMYLAINKPDI